MAMKDYLKKIPKEVKNLIYLASDIAGRNNMSAYLVGGFVRDLILGVKNLDLDILVEGDGIRFAEIFSEAKKAEVVRHIRFGTATVILKDHLKVGPLTRLRVNGERSRTIDIATARREYYPQPAHLPVVAFGTLKDDLMRRDFTINAMAININRQNFGSFIDFFGGKADLLHKKIRVLHNSSFIDDPTRILRAIRFEQRYNFRIEEETLRLLKEAVRLKMLEKVQPQRLRDELILILKEEQPLKELKRIEELAGFDFISPGLSLSKKALAFLKSIEKQVGWFRKTCPKHRRLDTWLIYFIGLIGALNKNNIKLICKRFAFRKGEEKRILTYKELNPNFIRKLSCQKIKPSKIFNLLKPQSYEVMILLKAKYINQHAGKHIKDFLQNFNSKYLYISGEDLRRLGLMPGPYYRKLFRCVLNAKVDGLVRTKKEELELIKKLSKGKSYGFPLPI